MRAGWQEYIKDGVAVIPFGVTDIERDAYSECLSLRRVEIPNSVAVIGRNAFRGCKNLESLELPNTVTEIEEGAFCNCESLVSIDIPNSVHVINSAAFNGCINLITITIPNSVMSIGPVAFRGCLKLSCVKMQFGIKHIDEYSFAGCTSLETIEIPESVEEIGEGAFRHCTRLSDITVPKSVRRIGNLVLSECPKLNSIQVDTDNQTFVSLDNCLIEKSTKRLLASCNYSSIPDEVQVIGLGVYVENAEIIEISFPKCVSEIEPFAFYKCFNLTRIEIPNSVNKIGFMAFGDCPLLVVLLWKNNPDAAALLFKDDTFAYLEMITLYTPVGTGYAYRHHPYFSRFKEIKAVLQ